jgi:glycosyltransferase involved in cell wall biosynthesis
MEQRASPPPLRILHIVLGSEPGGLSRYVIDLSDALREGGHAVTVAGDRGAAHAMFERAQLNWIDIPLKGGPIAFIKSASRLRRFLQDHPVDVLHTHYRRATLLARRLQVRPRGVFTSALPGAEDSVVPLDPTPFPPILYTLHLSHINITGPRRWLSDFGDHTHAASEDARQWLIREARVPSERITLIPHGIDPQRFPHADSQTKRNAKVALGLDPHALVASYVGRFEHPKNEAWLLDLACATRGQMPNLHVVLVGGGPDEPALRDRIDSQNLHDRVHLFGHRDDPASVYHASDLLLLPSAREGFSLVCAEAMSAGVPVLRTRTSGTAELIIENVTGRSVEIDHDKFIDAAITMLRDPAALARMGTAAARHVRDNFTFDRQVERTIELYRRLSKPEVHRGR